MKIEKNMNDEYVNNKQTNGYCLAPADISAGAKNG